MNLALRGEEKGIGGSGSGGTTGDVGEVKLVGQEGTVTV